MASSDLDVLLNGELAGRLSESAAGIWTFAYVSTKDAADGAAPISLALPRHQRVYQGDRVRAVFCNLLPEGEIRVRLAQSLGISERNDFALLARLAGDCPGAVSLRPVQSGPSEKRVPRQLDEAELRNAIAILPVHPLLAEADGLRVTLPGEFDKLPVRYADGAASLMLDGQLTTHILKPARPGLRESVMNEAYVSQLASVFGLPVAPCEIIHGQVAVLCVTRVDRSGTEPVNALHMEDFCQIAGLNPHEKFAREGGLGLHDIARMLRDLSARPAADLRALVQWTVFSFLVGFGAGHAKQLALLYGSRAPRLAPFFGLWSTHVYPGMNYRMGFPVGGEDRPDWMTVGRWHEFARQIGVRGSYVMEVLRDAAVTLPQLAAEVEDRFQRQNGFAGIVRQIRALIDQRARQLLVSLEAELSKAREQEVDPAIETSEIKVAEMLTPADVAEHRDFDPPVEIGGQISLLPADGG
jgi:serine/threonine-protein kinase HipA